MKVKKAYWIFPLCLFFIFFPQKIYASEDNIDYQSKLIESAIQQNLYKDRYWNILLHYMPTIGGMESLIDDPGFFLASDGKRNPESELFATIRAFFSPSYLGKKHPKCRFPGRYLWLKKALQIDEEALPSVNCFDLENTLKKINPKQTVLIFASPSFSRSSTIFGHTLLRIDSDNRDELLSYAVNYSAHTSDEIGLGFALKGLTGHFKGYFSILPYYDKLREYSNLENRDIWEYYLDLNEEETYRMVLHILELENLYSNYYFLDENCSFNILFLLEAGRPSLNLVNNYWNRLGYGVIPLDTIDIIRRSGIISKQHYRPSPVAQIKRLTAPLRKNEQEAAKDIAIHGLSSEIVDLSQMSAEKKRQTLELGAKYLWYRYSKMKMKQKDFQDQFHQITNEMEGLVVDSASKKNSPEPSPPEFEHRPTKIDLGLGYRQKSPFTEITLRPAYRDLLEIGVNNNDASQVKIMEISGRYYEKGRNFKLQEATILNVLSLSERDTFFKPVSWKLLAGFTQNLFPNGDEDVVFQLSAGGGWSFSHPILGLLYALMETDLKMSNRFKENLAFGPGGTLGFLKKVTKNWSVNLAGQGIFYRLGENYNMYNCGFDQNLGISKNSSIFLNASIERVDTETEAELKFGWRYYF